jgi:TRIAD3 protein (E3 ubiquitin-protein ligase RNF216)
MLSEDFASMPMNFIMKHFYDAGMVIYTAYQSLADAERLWDSSNPSYNKLKQARRVKSYHPSTVEEKLTNPATPENQKRAYLELKDVRTRRSKWEGKIAAKRKREADDAAAKKKYETDEAANLELAMKERTMQECGCCFDDFPRNRMINCNNEIVSHYFCKRCARLHAETQIGSAKFELQCMSTDGCEASYSIAQRQLFLDANLTTALDRIEAETNLRLAGIENLASCPFCPYAAEYPPIEHERLFHCEFDSCRKTSCRMCLKESHIPKTCQENAREIGLDVRREVEEAMTAALVRFCNKCKGPFIKEDGCNKMNCPCGNIQCYVCSKSCQYNHFDDERRGGKSGNCPLFDDVQVRHEDETKRAEVIIVEKLKKEHPDVDPEDLEIRVSDAVKEDEENRKKKRWHPHEPFRLGLGVFGRPQIPPPQPLARAGNQERDVYRAAFEAQMAQEHAEVENMMNQAQNPGQQQPNLQG